MCGLGGRRMRRRARRSEFVVSGIEKLYSMFCLGFASGMGVGGSLSWSVG